MNDGSRRSGIGSMLARRGGQRGREADTPWELGQGWRDIARRAIAEIKQDNVQILAAGVAFWFFLALVPTIVAVVSVYGLVADPADVSKQVHRYDQALPREIVRFLDEQLRAITATSSSKLGFGLAFSVVAAVWSASKGSRALIAATNAAYDEEETRGFLRLRIMSLAFTAGVVALFAAGLAVIGFGPRVADHLGPAGSVLVVVLGWPLMLALALVALGALYRYGPDRENARWAWVTPGSVVATVLWLIGSALFSIYADHAGSLNETYGSLAAIAVVMLWLLLTALAILVGAEVNGEAERQTRHDSTEGEPAPLGARDAYVADTVAGETPEPVE